MMSSDEVSVALSAAKTAAGATAADRSRLRIVRRSLLYSRHWNFYSREEKTTREKKLGRNPHRLGRNLPAEEVYIHCPYWTFSCPPAIPTPNAPADPKQQEDELIHGTPGSCHSPRSKMSKAGVNLWMEKLLAGAISSGGDDLRGKQYGGNAGENKGKKDRSDS